MADVQPGGSAAGPPDLGPAEAVDRTRRESRLSPAEAVDQTARPPRPSETVDRTLREDGRPPADPTAPAPVRWSGSAVAPPPAPRRSRWDDADDDWAVAPAVDPWADQDTPWDQGLPPAAALPPTLTGPPVPLPPPTLLEPPPVAQSAPTPPPAAVPQAPAAVPQGQPAPPPPPPAAAQARPASPAGGTRGAKPRSWAAARPGAGPPTTSPSRRAVTPRRQNPAPPPVPAPRREWNPPPRPIRRKRRWPANLALFSLLSLVCCCGVPAYYAWPATRQYPVSATLPDTVADLTLRTDDASKTAAAKLSEQMRDQNASVEGTFAGIYGDRNGKRVTVFGVTGLRLAPGSDAQKQLDSLSGTYGLGQIKSFDPGESGVHEVCGVGRDQKTSIVVCAWADHGSLATVLFTRRSLEDSAELVDVLRSAVLTRG